MRALLVVVAATLALAGCGESGDVDAGGGESTAPPGSTASSASTSTSTSGGGTRGATALTTVARGSAGPMRAGEVVARSAEEWRRAWAAHGGTDAAPSVPPDVDFQQQMLVAVFQGERPSAGFEVSIEAAEPRGDGLEVRYAKVSPGPGCLAAAMITYPFHVVAVPRAAGGVAFTTEDRVKGCGP